MNALCPFALKKQLHRRIMDARISTTIMTLGRDLIIPENIISGKRKTSVKGKKIYIFKNILCLHFLNVKSKVTAMYDNVFILFFQYSYKDCRNVWLWRERSELNQQLQLCVWSPLHLLLLELLPLQLQPQSWQIFHCNEKSSWKALCLLDAQLMTPPFIQGQTIK